MTNEANLMTKISSWVKHDPDRLNGVITEIAHLKCNTLKEGVIGITRNDSVLLLDKEIANTKINETFIPSLCGIIAYTPFTYRRDNMPTKLTMNENANNALDKDNVLIFVLCDVNDVPDVFTTKEVVAHTVVGYGGLFETHLAALSDTLDCCDAPDDYAAKFGAVQLTQSEGVLL